MKETMRRVLAGVLSIVLFLSCANAAFAEIEMPETLTSIEEEAFLNDERLTGLVRLPSHVKSVGARAFAGTNVYAVDFPSETEVISAGAVESDSLSYIIVRNPSAQIANDAFDSIYAIFAPEGSTAQAYAYDAGARFVNLDHLVLKDGFYYEVTDSAALLCAKDATNIQGSVSIPDKIDGCTVESIAPFAFAGCTAMTAVEIPNDSVLLNGALDSLEHVHVTYRSAVPMISAVSASVSGEVDAGQSVLWTVDAASESANLTYAFELMMDGEVIAAREFGSSNLYSAVLNAPGAYSLSVVCKDDVGLSACAESAIIRVKSRPLEIVSAEAENRIYAEGDEIAWTVKTEDGTAPVMYDYVLYRNGDEIDRRDMVFAESYIYCASDAGEYELEVACVDADETLRVFRSGPVRVYSAEELCPGAPALIFGENDLPFAQEEENAPVYSLSRIQLNWEEVPYSHSYTLELSRRQEGEWISVLREEGLTQCDYSLSALLFADQGENCAYKLSLCSKGVQGGTQSVYYFSVIPAVIDETIAVNGAAETAWNQSSRHAGMKEFVIESDLPWEASSNADWVTWSAKGDVLTLNMAQRQDAGGTRTAAVTVNNGVNTAVITVRQGDNDFAPKLLAPQFSASADNPGSMPAGDFRIGWEEYDHNSVRLRVYESADDVLAFELLGNDDYAQLTEEQTGYQFRADTLYRFELAGVYGADYAAHEDEDDLLKSHWYVQMTDDHEITLNNQDDLTVEIVDEANIQVFATNFFTYTTDADWLTVEANATMQYDEEASVLAAVNTTGAPRTGHVYFACGSDTAMLTVNQPYIEPHIECNYPLSTDASAPTAVPYGLLPVVIYGVFGGWGTYADGTHTTINEWDDSADICLTESAVNFPVNDYDAGTVFWIRTALGDVSNTYYFKTDDTMDFDWIAINGARYQYELQIPSHAFDTTVKLRASGSWTAASDCDWLSVSPDSGSKVTSVGGKQITVSAERNATGKERVGAITFDCGGTQAALCVTQSASGYVKVFDRNYYVSSSAGSGHTRLEYDPDTFYKHLDGAEGELDLYIYSNCGFSAVCNADWLTFSGGESALSSTSGSELITIELAENAAGEPRTGTVAFRAGDTQVTVSIAQEPKMPAPAVSILNSGYTEGVDGEAGLLAYGDIEVQWQPVQGAENYVIEHNWGKYSYRVNEDRSSVYTHTIPKEVLAIDPETDVNISVEAYNQYDHCVSSSIWVYVVSDSAVLINGKPDAEWGNVDDLGESRELTITSTGAWTASAPAWISLSGTSGSSGDTITAAVLGNAGAAREGQIVFTVGDTQTVMPVYQCAALKDTAYLNDLPYSTDKGTPTLISAETSVIGCSWDIEPQVDDYSLVLREVGGSRIIEAEPEEGSYTFTDLHLTPGSIYSIYFERWVVGRYRDGVYYYFQAEPEEPWILADGRSSNFSELNADEDHESFAITCSGMWAARSDADWIMVYDESITQEDLDEWGETSAQYNAHIGHSGDTLCISVLANTTGNARKGNVTITSGGAEYTIPVTQYQSYVIAELTSPVLAAKKSESTILPYGNVHLRWNSGSGVTGKYQVIVYESDTQNSGYDLVAYNSGAISATSCTIPVSSLKEGYYYEVYLRTEVISGEYQRSTYYFQMGREHALGLTAQLRSSSVSLGGNLGVDAAASGGAGDYVYTYILMKDGEEVMRSSAHRGVTYYSFALSEAGAYSVVVYVQDADGTMASCTTGTVTVGSAEYTPAPTVTPAPAPTAEPTATPEPTEEPTPAPEETAQPESIAAPVIDEDLIVSSNGSLTIEWSRVENAAGYIVWRAVSENSGYSVIAEIDTPDVCLWEDTGLANGVEYFYKVQAVASDGTVSDFSTAAHAVALNTDQPGEGAEVSLSGSFAQSGYVVEIGGRALQLTGSVSCTGSTISRVTVNIREAPGEEYMRLMTYAFTGSQTSVDLEEYAEFRPDTAAYPFNTPGTYTLELWASTASGLTLREPLATATLTVVKFDAALHDGTGETTKTITLGEKWIVNGEVSVEGSDLGRVTVNAYATANSNMTDDFSAHSVSSVELQNWAAYTIDTTQEPFNKEGTYTLHVWAKDVNGVGGSHSLAQMTVKVVPETEITYRTIETVYHQREYGAYWMPSDYPEYPNVSKQDTESARTLKSSGCGIFTIAHAIQWLTNANPDIETVRDHCGNTANYTYGMSGSAMDYIAETYGILHEGAKATDRYLKGVFDRGGVVVAATADGAHYFLATEYIVYKEQTYVHIIDSSTGSTLSRGYQGYWMDSLDPIGGYREICTSGYYGEGHDFWITMDALKANVLLALFAS